MSAKEPKPGESGPNDPAPKTGESRGAGAAVGVSDWKTTGRIVRRAFPGPRGATALLRVAVDRAAYADLIAHAKESLEAEICGVLAGSLCEDDQGLFLHVAALIRGAAASQGATHVTFTQETWNHIHETLEKNHPKLQILGWYHSHPGFGVEFSEMDLFIQRHFFSSPTQIALVIDPLSGQVAICLNTPEGIAHLDKYWVEGREQACQLPKGAPAKAAPSGTPAALENTEAWRALEARMGQLIQVVDEQRAAYYRFLLFCGLAVCLGLIGVVGYNFYSNYRYRNDPPKAMPQYVPIPIKVGDKTIMVGVGVMEWDVPEELNAAYVELERQNRLAAQKEKDNALAASTNTPAAASSNTPATAPSNAPANAPPPDTNKPPQ
jgi:proteasome lid subunit RPN8/RPN11